MSSQNNNFIEQLIKIKDQMGKNTQNLMKQIMGDIEISDPFTHLSKQFKAREKKLKELQWQNKILLQENRSLRNKLKAIKNGNVSMESSINNGGTTEISFSAENSDRIQSVEQLKQIARCSDNQAQKIDQIYINISRYIFQAQQKFIVQHKNWSLKKQIKQNEIEKIEIPLFQYNQLIKLYSLIMADFQVDELMNNSKQLVNENPGHLKQHYKKLLKKLDITTYRNKNILFQSIAQKLQLAQEWKNYMNQTQQFSDKINKILQQKNLFDNPELNPRDIMFHKLGKIVNTLQFHPKEKRIWNSIVKQRAQQKLLDLDFFLQKIKDQRNYNSCVPNMTYTIIFIIKSCVEGLCNLLKIHKVANSIEHLPEVKQLYNSQIQEKIKLQIKEALRSNMWANTQSELEKIIKQLFEKINCQFRCFSTTYLYDLIYKS